MNVETTNEKNPTFDANVTNTQINEIIYYNIFLRNFVIFIDVAVSYQEINIFLL